MIHDLCSITGTAKDRATTHASWDEVQRYVTLKSHQSLVENIVPNYMFQTIHLLNWHLQSRPLVHAFTWGTDLKLYVLYVEPANSWC